MTAGLIQLLRRAVQPEDLFLAATLVLAPLLAGREEPASGFFEDRIDVLGGLFAIAAAIGAIVCMATRTPGASPLDPARSTSEGRGAAIDVDARMLFIGPYLGGVALVGAQGFDKLGVRSGDWLIGVAFVVAVASMIFADRLPVLRPELRRGLVTPFVLVAGGVFQGIVGDITRDLDVAAAFRELVSGGGVGGLPGGWPTLGLVLFVYGIIVAGTAVFYAMLIYAPRELAQPEPERGRWVIRFLLFVVVLVVGLLLRAATSGDRLALIAV